MLNIFAKLFPKKKPKKGGIAPAEYVAKVGTGDDISDDRTFTGNDDLTEIRYGSTTAEVVRDFQKNSPDVSHASETTVRLMITDSYKIVAKDADTDEVDVEATKTAQMFAKKLDKLPMNYDGTSPQTSINAISETLLIQLFCNGSTGAELVLDDSLMPSYIKPFSTDDIKYKSNGKIQTPYYSSDAGDDVDLNYPTVKIISLSQSPDSPYAESWYKSAVQGLIASNQFINDLRRAFRKANIPRVTATIAVDAFLKTLTPDILLDAEKLKAQMDATIQGITDQVGGLNPEDALVSFDTVKFDHLTSGNNSSHSAIETHNNIMNANVSSGLRILPSIIGRGESQTTASSESILFVKMVENLQMRINEFFEYFFTLALRLQGYNVVTTFSFKKPSLRTELEDESFLTMRQSRILEQLSYGFISDVEASLELTGDLPPSTMPPLSGTRFRDGTTPETIANPYSNTSVSGEGVNNTQTQKDANQSNSQPKTNQTGS